MGHRLSDFEYITATAFTHAYQEMEDALVHPERHQDLMVRVGGFSARFVTQAPDVQREILSRTLY